MAVRMACDTPTDSKPINEAGLQFCVVGELLKQNEVLIKSLEHFRMPIVYSSNGLELMNKGGEFTTVFILEEFEGEVFDILHKEGQRILGPTVVIQFAEQNEDLINTIRPLYTASMKNVVVCFSGFRSREEMSSMARLIHHMGGSIRRDFSVTRTTHLIASEISQSTEKFKYAVSLGVPIMTKEWIYQAWAQRHNINFNATNQELMQYKLLPFVGCKLAFLGYKTADEQDMIDICLKNGGDVVKSTDSCCTHLIVADGYNIDLSQYDYEVFILKTEWFWACIQMEAKAEEDIYKFENMNFGLTSSSFIMPVRGNKRQRLESVAQQLAAESQENTFYYNISETGKKSNHTKLGISESIDTAFFQDKPLDILTSDVFEIDPVKSPPFDMRSLSPRQQVCLELFQTENNYVGILHTVIMLFMEPLEEPNQTAPLLDSTEVKTIFGYLPPIYEIHIKICKELAVVVHSKSDDQSIGNLILNHANELMKSYPPFVNFFEKSKEVLANCDATKPRFHAFLKRCESKPECGRQTLQELLIRPVQRLPSIILLLSDILKHTPKSNPDNQALEKAIQALKNVLMHINEDKRKTEGQMEMFDIIKDIENCPPNLLSSHRTLVFKKEMIEITDLLCKKGGPLTMFLFTDVLEVCKKRNKGARKNAGAYKHLALIQLSHIKRVVNVTETEHCKNTFAFVAWSIKELKEILYVFVLLDEESKDEFLHTMCRQIANSICRADTENLLTNLEPQQLDLPVSDHSGNVLTKALNLTRCKIGRAWSFKTAQKQGLSRAVSTIISPWRISKQPSSSNLQTLKLSSVMNLSVPESHFTDFSISPFEPKKRKSNTVGICAAEHL